MKINPYLCLPGTAKEALKLYSEVFKTEPDAISYYKDVPADAGMTYSDAAADRVLHASIKVGENLFMVSDAPEGQDNTVTNGTNVQVSVHPDSREDADRVYALLVAGGGKATMPMADAFWGDYFGMVTDRFGVCWMINFSANY